MGLGRAAVRSRHPALSTADTMTIDESFFTSNTIHPKEVTLSDGVPHTLHFRELGGHEFIRFRQEQASDDPDVSAKAVPRLIAAALCEPDGKPALTEAKALTLKPEPMKAIMAALMEVNTFTEKKASPSAAANGSTTS